MRSFRPRSRRRYVPSFPMSGVINFQPHIFPPIRPRLFIPPKVRKGQRVKYLSKRQRKYGEWQPRINALVVSGGENGCYLYRPKQPGDIFFRPWGSVQVLP